MTSPSRSSTDVDSNDQDLRASSNSSEDLQAQQEKQREEETGSTELEKDDTVRACLQVLGAFFLMFNSWYVQSFFSIM